MLGFPAPAATVLLRSGRTQGHRATPQGDLIAKGDPWESVEQAVSAAIQIVEGAADRLGVTARACGVEAVTEEELDRRNAEPALAEK
jgi:hypothetical protein